MRIELTEMSPSGEAVGRAAGLVVFVRYGLPGEIVEAAITHRRKSYARGTAIEIIRRSPARVTPPCPHFGVCGGCEWQHATYEAQVRFKTHIVAEQLGRIGKLPDINVLPCIPCPLPYGYRNHTQVAMSTDGAIGYRKAGSQQIVPVHDCPILDLSLQQLLHFLIQATIHPPDHLREIHLRAGVATDERMIVFELDRDSLEEAALEEGTLEEAALEEAALEEAALEEAARKVAGLVAGLSVPMRTAIAVSTIDGKSRIVVGSSWLRERVQDITYRYSATTFFQVNTVMAGQLVDTVMQALELDGTEHVLDLYCGAGLFTAPISARAGQVMGIESSPSAVRDARRNLHGQKNATIIQADVRHGLLDSRVNGQTWQRVVMDPPRAGVDAEVLSKIAQIGASRLVYVSCEPATLARDAGRLDNLGYRLQYAQPLDLFPQTHHVETVAVFDYVAQ